SLGDAAGGVDVLGDHALVDRGEQVVLALEVVIERRLAEVDLLGKVPHRGGSIAPRAEDLDGLLKHLVWFRVLSAHCGSPLGARSDDCTADPGKAPQSVQPFGRTS